jgi:hypothetical protein
MSQRRMSLAAFGCKKSCDVMTALQFAWSVSRQVRNQILDS